MILPIRVFAAWYPSLDNSNNFFSEILFESGKFLACAISSRAKLLTSQLAKFCHAKVTQKSRKSHAEVTQKSRISTNSYHMSRITSHNHATSLSLFIYKTRNLSLNHKSHANLTQISLTICHASRKKVTQPEKFC